jgi:hypothetical protein
MGKKGTSYYPYWLSRALPVGVEDVRVTLVSEEAARTEHSSNQ